MLKWSDIPGYREAVKRENDIRDASFLDLTTSICGVEIRQMTPRDLLILDGIGNPLMYGGLPSPAELADFLWKLSPLYKENARLRRYLFGVTIRKMNFIAAVQACRRYVDDTFQDSPASSGASAPYVSWCAHLVVNISTETGWSEAAILNTPLKRLFQYLKAIRRRDNPQAPMHNPSDKIRGDYIRLLHGRSQLLNILKRRAAN